MKRKLLSAILIVALAASAIACSKKDKSDSTTGAADNEPGVEETEDAPVDETDPSDTNVCVDVHKVLGHLIVVNEDLQENPVTAVKLVGNSTGSEDDINGLEPSADSIRCIFEMNEWISIYPITTDTYDAFSVFVMPHEDDCTAYTAAYLSSDDHPNAAVSYFSINEYNDISHYCTDVYVNPEYNAPGFYDLVLVANGNPIAVIPVEIYAEGELQSAGNLADLMAAECQ